MDWDRIEGNWKQFRGKVKAQWGKLTDDDLDVIEGNRDQLEGRLQERYGKAKDDVRKDVDTWLNRVLRPRNANPPLFANHLLLRRAASRPFFSCQRAC